MSKSFNALLVVDIQNDFMPGGALGVKNAQEVIPLIDMLVHMPFDFIIATKDWHPRDHGSFASAYEKKAVGEHVTLLGIDQILWPNHCIQGSPGAEFAPDWDTSRISYVVHKGTDPLIDSYSSFFDNAHKKSTGLHAYLQDKQVKNLFIAGIATDYCVKYSALDALALGFHTYVIVDACRGVNVKPTDSQEALLFLQKKGVSLLSSKEVTNMFA